MAEINVEIAAYKAMEDDLRRDHMGKWVVIRHSELVGIFDSFEIAAAEAVRKFGGGPYLIRQIGAPPVSIPASLMYHVERG
jgi:hypothetical protein